MMVRCAFALARPATRGWTLGSEGEKEDMGEEEVVVKRRSLRRKRLSGWEKRVRKEARHERRSGKSGEQNGKEGLENRLLLMHRQEQQEDAVLA